MNDMKYKFTYTSQTAAERALTVGQSEACI